MIDLGPFLQIVVTVWLSAHPFSYTIPKIYFTDAACEARIEQLLKRVRKHRFRRLEMECLPTDKRNI